MSFQESVLVFEWPEDLGTRISDLRRRPEVCRRTAPALRTEINFENDCEIHCDDRIIIIFFLIGLMKARQAAYWMLQLFHEKSFRLLK